MMRIEGGGIIKGRRKLLWVMGIVTILVAVMVL